MALIAVFEAIGAPGRLRSLGWQSDAPVGEWHGVTVDVKGVVTGISLNGYPLHGEIPVELGSLTNLRALSLSGCPFPYPRCWELFKLQIARGPTGGLGAASGALPPQEALTGEIPPELASLVNLVDLNLSGNELTGEIPSELGSLVKLRWLNLSGNQLFGEIPPELGNLAKLERLGLSGNKLTGNIPSEMGNFPKLGELYLYDNQLSGEIPPVLGDLANMRRLWLSANQLTGNIPLELGKLTRLRELSLRGNLLTGCLPAALRRQLEPGISYWAFCDIAGP